jgi:hypothetical protein
MAARPLRIASRALAATLATTLGTLSLPAVAATNLATSAAEQDSEVERLYVEGQERYGNDDFSGAAESWSRLLEKLPEAQANKATRENVLLNITQAYLDAYNRSRKDDGKKDIEHLRKGKSVLDDYFAGYRKAYGDRAGVSAAVQEKSDELEDELRKAEDELAAAAAAGDPTTDPGTGPTEPGPTTGPTDGGQKVIVLKPQNSGNGLIVGGAVVAFLGIGAIAMGAIGAVRAPKAEDDFNNATTDLEREEADFRGKQANQLTIAGFVLGPLLLGGAAAMIYFGVKKKKSAEAEAARSVTVAPMVGPRLTGIGLSGRF